MVTVRETTPTGLMVTVIKVHEVRVGDRIYLRHTVPGDVRTVTAVHKSKSDTAIEFDRGPALEGDALRRCRGVLWRVNPDAEVGDLPDLFDLFSPLEQWIELGGAIRVEHTSRQYEWSAQMLAVMHRATGMDVYRCYAVDPRSLLIEQRPDGNFDETDPRPQVLIHSRMDLLQPVAWHLIRAALGLESAESWRNIMDQINEAASELGVQFADASELVAIRPARAK